LIALISSRLQTRYTVRGHIRQSRNRVRLGVDLYGVARDRVIWAQTATTTIRTQLKAGTNW